MRSHRLSAVPALLVLVVVLVVLLASSLPVPAAEPDRAAQPAPKPKAIKPQPADKVLFTFAIFGDNKWGGKILDATFTSMKQIKPSFVIGMGDHFTTLDNLKTFDASIRKAFGTTDAFYQRFYLTAGDNEAGAYAGRQDAIGAERPFFYHAGLFDKKTDKPLRKTIADYDPKWLDYYARLRVGEARVHILNLYDQDGVLMQPETVAFADRACKKIRADLKPGEPWIIMAHDGAWWKAKFKKDHDLYFCDLLLGASWHVYECYGTQGGGTCMALNTSAVERGGRSWYAVMVLKDKLVLLNINDAEFAVKGVPGCHVKPFGKPGADGDPAAWFDLLKAYGKTVKGDWGPEPKADEGDDKNRR